MRKVSGIRGPRAPRVAMADPAMAASPDMSGMGMPPGMKHGGKVPHAMEEHKKHAAGNAHHSEHYGKHAAGYALHHDHIRKHFHGK